MPKNRHSRFYRHLDARYRAALASTTLQESSEAQVGVVEKHDNRSHDPQMATSVELSSHAAAMASEEQAGHVLLGEGWELDEESGALVFPGEGGASSFFELTEVIPEDFTGANSFLVVVNAAGDGLEFVDGDTLYDPLGAATDEMADHLLEADPHPDYLLQDEADLLYSWMGHLQTVVTGGTGLTTVAADRILYTSAANVFSAAPITAFGLSLIDDANEATARTTLGLAAGGAGDIWVEKGGDTMTGALLLANGTVSAPAVAFASSTGTGLYRIGADILGFAVAGAEAVRMEADGDVLVANKLGVGVTPSVKFHISQSVDGDVAARVQNPNAGTSARAYFQIVGDAAGLVGYFGVGSAAHTTFPSTFFLVSDSGATGGMLFRPAAGGVRFAASGSSANDLIVAASSVVYIGTATANSKMSRGLTINQAGFDDDIFALQSTDVAHGMTDIDDTATFCAISKINAADGGAALKAFTEATIGLFAIGYVTTEDTAAKSTSSVAAVMVDGRKKSGTGVTALGTTANIFAIRNNNATQVVVAGNGDTYQNGTGWTTYDAFDDLKLLDEVEKAILNPFDALRDDWVGYLHYNRSILEKAGLVHFNPDGHHFVNNSGMLRLHNGALRQIHSRLERIEERMSVIEEALGI